MRTGSWGLTEREKAFDEMDAFVEANRYPVVRRMSPSTYHQMAQAGKPIVMAVLRGVEDMVDVKAFLSMTKALREADARYAMPSGEKMFQMAWVSMSDEMLNDWFRANFDVADGLVFPSLLVFDFAKEEYMHFPDWDTVPVPSEQAVHDFLAGVVRGDHEVRSLKSSSGWSKWTKPIYTQLTIFSNTVVKSTVETLEGVFGSVTGMFGAKGGSAGGGQEF